MTTLITDVDQIALEAAHQIEALADDLHDSQKTARIQLIVLDAIAHAQLNFADFLAGHRPSATQLAESPDYNMVVVRTLEWVEQEARKRACR